MALHTNSFFQHPTSTSGCISFACESCQDSSDCHHLPALILHRASSPALWVPVSLSTSLPAFTLHLPSVLNTVASAILCKDRSDHVTPLLKPAVGLRCAEWEPEVCPPSHRPADISPCVGPQCLLVPPVPDLAGRLLLKYIRWVLVLGLLFSCFLYVECSPPSLWGEPSHTWLTASLNHPIQ